MEQTNSVKHFLLFFTKKLRLSNPWNYKVPFLICIPYLMFLASRYDGNEAFVSILASICVIIGVAGFGYLTNDLGDKKKDALIEKQNITGQLSLFEIVFLFLLFFSFALLPWLYLPYDKWSAMLLAFQFALFSVYAFPPFRLKEKTIAGVVVDALYAHVNPAVLAAYTFHLFTGRISEFNLLIAFLGTWQLLLGVRNILFHHLKDYENDLKSGTKTFATVNGEQKTVQLLTKFILPLEVVTFLCFIIFIAHYFIFIVPLVIAFWLMTYIKVRHHPKDYRSNAYFLLDDLYILWFPVFMLAALLPHSINYLQLFILHILLFKNGIKLFVLKIIGN